MKRSISSIALLFTSVSAILGSGWLFTNYYTAVLAGPSALLSWLLGGLAMIFLAFIFAELCAMLPIMGSSTRIPQYTHGTLVNFLFSWIIWLAYASLVPTEVQAVIQYLSYFFPSFIHQDSSLTVQGYCVATVLMLAISAVNIFSLRWLLRCNNALTILKILIPTVLSIVIIYSVLSSSSHHALHPADQQPFFAYGWHGVFAAITTGGIVFAFNGFKQACEMAGEAKNPRVALPFAIIGSIIVCLVIYLLLQWALQVSIQPANIQGGWKHLMLPGGGPMAALLRQDHLTAFLPLLYFGAIAGPVAAGMIYASSSSRSLYGMSKNSHIPEIFQHLSAQGNPSYAIVLNFILGMLLFAPLPGWNHMISFLTSLMAITYAIAPVCLLSLRYQIPNQNRPFRLPFVKIWSTLSFYLCTLLMYWSGWNIISKLGFALLIGLIVLFIHRHFIHDNTDAPPLDAKAAIWLWPYFAGIGIISYLGNFNGGHNVIQFGWDFVLIAILCLIIMPLSQKFKLPPTRTHQYIEDLKIKGCVEEDDEGDAAEVMRVDSNMRECEGERS